MGLGARSARRPLVLLLRPHESSAVNIYLLVSWTLALMGMGYCLSCAWMLWGYRLRRQEPLEPMSYENVESLTRR